MSEPVSAPLSIAVGVITYKRPKSLERLFAALAKQTFTGLQKPDITVVVVDNDADGSARTVCDAAGHAHGLKVSYVVEPKLGIPIARNRVLDSLPDSASFILWVDDDETPAPDWVETLLTVQAGVNADIVMGAVEAVLPEGTPAWVKRGGFFNRRRFIDRASLVEGATNNCLMAVDAIKAVNLRFDESLRYAGGTDTIFFRAAEAAGLHLVWSGEAVVQDYIQAERCTLGWLMMRHYRSGITLAISDWQVSGVLGTLRRLWRGFSKLVQGIVILPLSIEGYHELVRALLMISRGAGMIAGVFGARFDEYSPKRLHGGLQE